MHLYPPDAADRLGFDMLRARLDGYAQSELGRAVLADLAPSSDRAWVEQELTRVGQMQDVLGFDDPLPMAGVADLRPLLRRIAPKGAVVDAEDLSLALNALVTLRRLHGYLRTRKAKYPDLWVVAEGIVPQKELETHLAKILDERGQLRDDASAELQKLTRQINARSEQLRNSVLKALRDAVAKGYATEDQPTIRGGRAVIPVRAEAKRKVQGFVHDVSASGQTVYIEPAAALDLNNEVRELEAARRREIERILREATAHLRSRRQDLAPSLDAYAQLDAYAARGRLANDLGALVPSLNDDGHLRIVRGRNPVLLLHFQNEAARKRQNAETAAEKAAIEPRAVVPLDLNLGDPLEGDPSKGGTAYHTLVITGPNAGGKSVAMKTVGVLALMVAHGLPVPCDAGSSFPLLDRLYVDIGDQQSMEEDLSTFTSHLTNIRTMLKDAGPRSLVLIDEAGTGTDPAEGGALAQAVLEGLHERGARTIATTHHGTLKAFAHNTPGVENGSMQFDRATLAPTYRFQAGIPGSSYAFDIAARVGLDGDTIGRARALVGEGKASLEDLIATFEARAQEAESRVEEAESRAKEAESVRKKYDDLLEQLRARKDAYRAEAIAQADQIVKDANARIERAVREIKEAEAEKETTKEVRADIDKLKRTVRKKQQQVEQRQRTRKRRTQKKDAPPAIAGPIREGDQVRIDGAGAVGEVLELGHNEALVALGALKTRVKTKRLTKVGGPREQRVEVRAPKSDRSGGAGADLPAIHARTRIDLRGQRVEEALPEVDRLVDEALAAGLPSVEVLHGKGTGALRIAIQRHLQQRRDVTDVREAAWNQGGAGVTVVELG
ncbi:MAG: endonuclease MutS2 [Bacteroidota bacterium]